MTRAPLDPRLLRHARSSRSGIAVLALLGGGQAAATVVLAIALTALVAPGHFAVPHRWAPVLLASAYAGRALLSWAEQVVAVRTAARVTDELRRRLLAVLPRRGPAWVASFGAGRLTAVLTSGLAALRPWFAGYLPALILGVALPPLVILVMAAVDPASALIALATLPLIPLLGALIGWATAARARERWQADARLAGHFLDVVQGLPTLRVFGRATRQTKVIADLTDRHRSATLRVLRVAFLSSTALDLVGTLSVGLIAVEAGLRVAAGHLPLAPALLVILLAPEAYRPLREMAARYHAATNATAAITDVDEALTLPPAAAPTPAPGEAPAPAAAPTPAPVEAPTPAPVAAPAPAAAPTHAPAPADRPAIAPAPAPVAAPAPAPVAEPAAEPARAHEPAPAPSHVPARATASEMLRVPSPDRAESTADGPIGVAVSGLRARYLGATVDALVLPALTVAPGEIVALRGPSGAGKTTALRVLAGLHPATAGEFTAPDPLYLPQRPTLPHARRVADLFPAGSAEATLAAVGLTLHPDTPLGEHGSGVSAGQRHRLALAAVLQKATTTPATLLLDEPTAHLDAETERLVITRLRATATAGSAVLVVAHRPALLAAADRTVDIAAPTPADSPRPADPSTGGLQPTDTESAALHRPAPSPTTDPQSRSMARGARPAAPRLDSQPAARLDSRSGAPGAGSRSEAPGAGSRSEAPGASSRSEAPGASSRSEAPGADSRSGAPGAGSRSGSESSLSRPGRRRALPWPVAVALGSGSSLAGLLLTGAAAWLLVRAATLPPVLTLSAAVVLVRGSAVARPLLRYLERLVSHDVAFARLGARRARVYAALIPRVPGPRLRRRGDLLTRVVDDVDARVDGLLRGRLPALAAAATLAIATLTAVAIAPSTAVPLAIGLLTTVVIAPALAARQAAREDATTAAARAGLHDAMVETVDGIEELPGGSRIPEERSRTLARLESRAAQAAGQATALAHLGWGIAVTGVAWALTHAAALSPEWTAVLLLAVVALGETALTLPDAATARRRDAGAAARLADLASSAIPAAFPTPDISGFSARRAIGDISVRGLSAGWDSAHPPALKDLDLDLPAGARVAVVGRSGSGKSTLGAVVARLLDPRAGTITAGGRDLRALPEDEIRGRIVLVGDETGHVFASTVRENLRLARPAATDDELLAALRRVRLDGWLAALPDGLGAWLGTGGSTMSGGQARRLATARALLADPEVLILDEPTEGLDTDLAEALMADLLDAAAGRTVLLLTHRPEGLDRVDQVIDLEPAPVAA